MTAWLLFNGVGQKYTRRRMAWPAAFAVSCLSADTGALFSCREGVERLLNNFNPREFGVNEKLKLRMLGVDGLTLLLRLPAVEGVGIAELPEPLEPRNDGDDGLFIGM